MVDGVMKFVTDNIIGIATVLVGFVALVVYKLNKRDEMRSAAAMIVMQIDAINLEIEKLSRYCANDNFDIVALYESQALVDCSYWEKYKHLFVNKMDSHSFQSLDSFYTDSKVINDQIKLIKQMVFQHLSLIQSGLFMIQNDEFRNELKFCDENPLGSLIESLTPAEVQGGNLSDNNVTKLSEVLEYFKNTGGASYVDRVIRQNREFSAKTSPFLQYLNQLFPMYTPQQLIDSIKKNVSHLAHIDISQGYNRLTKYSGRR